MPILLIWLTCAPVNPGVCMRHWETYHDMAACTEAMTKLPRDPVTHTPAPWAVCERVR